MSWWLSERCVIFFAMACGRSSKLASSSSKGVSFDGLNLATPRARGGSHNRR